MFKCFIECLLFDAVTPDNGLYPKILPRELNKARNHSMFYMFICYFIVVHLFCVMFYVFNLLCC